MLALLAASLIWAFSFGLIKTQLAGYDPRAVAFVRLALAALVFAPWLPRLGAARLRLRLAVLGAVQFGLMYVLYIASYAHLPAYAVALFTVFTPIYVVLMDDVWTRRFVPRHLLAALMAVAGGALVLWRDLPPGEAWPGILLLQGANLCFASGQLVYRRLRSAHGADPQFSLYTRMSSGVSSWQRTEHPSPPTWFPSSHSSAPSMIPLPQHEETAPC